MGRIPLRNKLVFTSSSLGSEALTQSRNLWLVYFYAPPANSGLRAYLPLGLLGALLFAGRFIEAISDSLIGYLSDRTSSRLGRRLPYILIATPFWAVLAFLLFAPPGDAGRATIAVYLFVVLEAYFLFSTLSGGPYEALLPEVAASSRERMSIVSWRVYFGVAGAAVGLIGSGILVDHVGFRVMALVVAGLACTLRYLGVAGIWRYVDRTQAPARISYLESVRATFTNRYFLLFLPSFVLFQLGLQLLIGLLPYFVDVVFPGAVNGTRVSILTAVTIGSMALAIPLFRWLAERSSKRQAFRQAMLAAAFTFAALFFAGFIPGISRWVQVIVAMSLVGMPLAGVYLFPEALLADICDYDARLTGMQRQATYYGAKAFIEKVASSAAPAILTFLLLLGKSASHPTGVRLVGPTAALFVLAGYLVFRAYNLPDASERLEVAPGSGAAMDQQDRPGTPIAVE